MQDVLLLAAVAAMFTFGWFLMDKLDCFLESHRHVQELQLPSGDSALRIGFCNPTTADSITDALEEYSRLYPKIPVRIFCGSEEDLLKGFSAGKFTVIFLPENAEIPACVHCDSGMISLNDTPVMMKYGGLPIEPLTDGHITQKALWMGEAASAFADCFRKGPEDKFSVRTRAK